MFLENSRYFNQATVEVKTPDGRTVKAVVPRKLPAVAGDPYTVKSNDRLDILAQQQYDQADRFWRIADANTELEAKALDQNGREIILPNT
jgi:hypothetical protein